MSRVLISGTERKVSLWAGGSSSQICIYPADAQYAQRNFLYRISTAVAENDEWSDYTPLPGVTRHLLMLDGSAVVEHEGHHSIEMKPYVDIDLFDGGWVSRAKGKVRDFNLMTKEGCQGKVSVLSETQSLSATMEHRLLFCSEGEAVIRFHDESISLSEEDALLLTTAEDCEVILAEGSYVICCDMKL